MSNLLLLVAGEILLWLGYWSQRRQRVEKTGPYLAWCSTVLAFAWMLVVIIAIAASTSSLAELEPKVFWPLYSAGVVSCLYSLLNRLLQRFIVRFAEPDPDSAAVSRFYRRTDQGWSLRPHFIPIAKAAEMTAKALYILDSVLLASGLMDSAAVSLLWLVIPVAGAVPLYALANFLGGQSFTIESAKQIPQPVRGQIHFRLRKAAEYLTDLFPEALLSYETDTLSAEKSGSDSILRTLERSHSSANMAAAAYFRSEWSQEELDPDLVDASVGLLNGRNTMILNPFYQDFGMYLAFPLNESLKRSRRALILCMGEHQCQVIKEWIEQSLDPNDRFQDRWKVSILDTIIPECQVGVLACPKLYDAEVMQANRKFFQDCEYVVLMQPSTVLATSQVALSVLADLLRAGYTKPVYCVIDRDLRGLKDTLSHTLKTSFSSEVYIGHTASLQTLMVWDSHADYHSMEYFSRQTRYLGGGIDLAVQAVSMQVPFVTWISEHSIPVLDMQSTASAAWRSLCPAMDSGTGQHVVHEKIKVDPVLWNTKQENAQFLILEDEFHNPFSLAVSYMSRATEEVALCILSEPYLLRDYFCDNSELFLSNPNAVPALVPAYVRSSRNILLKLILKMMAAPLAEEDIRKDLDLCGIHTDKPVQEVVRLLEQYTNAQEDVLTVKKIRKMQRNEPGSVTFVSVRPEKFEEYFSRSLKSVSYVLEDEVVGQNILDTKLYSLVPQTLLPGQVFVCGGNRYIVQLISPENGVVLQRASNREEVRRSYKQLRRYKFGLNSLPSEQPDGMCISSHSVNGIRFDRVESDFDVITTGYIEHPADGKPRIRDCSRDQAYRAFDRHYNSKQVLYIRFPEFSQQTLQELASVLQEMLVSIFPDGWQYLAVLAARTEGAVSGHLYASENLSDGVLAIVEDSDMDLGLLDAFEHSFFELLKITQDYLRWQSERVKTYDPFSGVESCLGEEHADMDIAAVQRTVDEEQLQMTEGNDLSEETGDDDGEELEDDDRNAS